jgi:two-component system, NarL family, nitrate/nitrite response regulator NarL
MSDRIRVIVADTDPLYRQGAAAALEAAGLDVIAEADSRDAAVQLVSRLCPDVVLIERLLAGDSAYAVRQVAGNDGHARLVVLGSIEDADGLRAAFGAGIAGYVLRSVSAEELVHVVNVVAAGATYATPQVAWALATRQAEAASASSDEVSRLSARELDVLTLVGSGLTNNEIAQLLGVAETTVKSHMTRIMKKLDLRSRVQAAVLARRAGLPQSEDGV